MKAKFIIPLILFIPVWGMSQADQTIDLVLGLEYSYRDLTTASDQEATILVQQGRDDRETGKLNWRAGFNYNLKLSHKFFLKTGLRLASVGYKDENRTDIRWPSEYDDMGQWTPDPALPREVQFVYDYWFIEIPIAARFEFNQKKIAPFLELGISPSIYMTTRVKQITDINTNSEFQSGGPDNFNNLHIVGVFSFGANYSLNDKLQFFGQPTFRYHLTRLAEAPISEYLFNRGVEIGIRRRIS